MSEDKIKLKDSVRLFVSPADNGFACGVIEDEWMYTDEGYFCSVIARGMMKIACDNPQDVFEEGLEGFRLDLEYKKSIENTKSNGSDVLEDSKVINIVPFINKLIENKGKIIFESPDGGKTVYKREFGNYNKREKL